jgi:hypothetical protein
MSVILYWKWIGELGEDIKDRRKGGGRGDFGSMEV